MKMLKYTDTPPSMQVPEDQQNQPTGQQHQQQPIPLSTSRCSFPLIWMLQSNAHPSRRESSSLQGTQQEGEPRRKQSRDHAGMYP